MCRDVAGGVLAVGGLPAACGLLGKRFVRVQDLVERVEEGERLGLFEPGSDAGPQTRARQGEQVARQVADGLSAQPGGQSVRGQGLLRRVALLGCVVPEKLPGGRTRRRVIRQSGPQGRDCGNVRVRGPSGARVSRVRRTRTVV